MSSFLLLLLLRSQLRYPGSPLLVSCAVHQTLLFPASSCHSTNPAAAIVPSLPDRAQLAMPHPLPILLLRLTAIQATRREPAGPPGGNGLIYRSGEEKGIHADLQRCLKAMEMLHPNGICRPWVLQHDIEPRERI